MKILSGALQFLPFAAFVALPALGYAQVPAGPHHHSLTLEAISVSNGGTTTVKSDVKGVGQIRSAFGAEAAVSRFNQQHDTVHRTNVRVDIRNLGRTPDTIKLEWYFIAAPVGGGAARGKDFVFDQGAEDISVIPNGTESREITSKEARYVLVRTATMIESGDPSNEVTFAGGGRTTAQSTQTGIMMRGWVVRLLDGGQVVATRGSSQAYEDLAKDNAQLKDLMTQPAGLNEPGLPRASDPRP